MRPCHSRGRDPADAIAPAVLFLRPYSLKRPVVKGERKERDIEAGPAEKAEKIADAAPSQLAVALAPGDNEAAEEVRRSTSKTRESTEGGDDAGTIAGEPEVQKQ